MDNLDVSRSVAELMSIMIDGERAVEILRQDLSKRYCFTPISLFRTLVGQDNVVTVNHLLSFASKMGSGITQNIVESLVYQYDGDRDGVLSFEEFENFVLPSQDPESRETAQRRNGHVNYDVEFNFHRLLEREGFYQNEINVAKHRISAMPNFSAIQVYQEIDRHAKGYIDVVDFEIFLRNHRLVVRENETMGVIRRLGRSLEGAVNCDEFCDGLVSRFRADYSMASAPGVQTSQYRSPGKMRASSPLRASGSSPQRGLGASPYRVASSPLKASALYASPQYRQQSQSVYTSQSPIKARNQDESDLVTMFQAQIELQNAVERSKERLGTHPDFNLPGFYNLFSQNSPGYITLQTFKHILSYYNIHPVGDEPTLLFKQYSGGKTWLDLEAFSKIFTPKHHVYARILLKKPAVEIDMLSPETEHSLQTLMGYHFEAEAQAEIMRIRLASSYSFSDLLAFEELDYDRNGTLTIDEFGRKLALCGLEPDIDDLRLLMDRFDPKGRGEVSYREFAMEMAPKSPEKRR